MKRNVFSLYFCTFAQYPKKTRNEFKNLLKASFGCCKLKLIVKNKTRLGKVFQFKDYFLKEVTYPVVHNFHNGLMRCLNLRPGEHIGRSPITKKKVKPENNGADNISILQTSIIL